MSIFKKTAEANFEKIKKDLARLTGTDEAVLDVQNPGDGFRFQIVLKKGGKEVAFLPSGHYRTSDFIDYLEGIDNVIHLINRYLHEWVEEAAKRLWKL